MGFWDHWYGDLLTLNPVGLMARLGTDEDFRSKWPVVGAITGARSDEEKALQAKQQQLAEESRKRQQQNEQTRMNMLAQKVMAFNPQNQMMARVYGPDAAFTPDQFAQMVQNPTPDTIPWGAGNEEEDIRQYREREAERARQARVKGAMAPVPQVPQPFAAPQAAPAKRFG